MCVFLDVFTIITRHTHILIYIERERHSDSSLGLIPADPGILSCPVVSVLSLDFMILMVLGRPSQALAKPTCTSVAA